MEFRIRIKIAIYFVGRSLACATCSDPTGPRQVGIARLRARSRPPRISSILIRIANDLFSARACIILVFAFVLSSVVFIGCARAPIKSVDEAMRLAEPPAVIQDDLGLLDLAQALSKNLTRLKRYTPAGALMQFGPANITREEYVAAIEGLIAALNADASGALYVKMLREKFDFYEVYGGDRWGDVFITSYFEPVIQGRKKKKKPYTQALYGVPGDLVSVNMGEFAKTFPNLRPYQMGVIEQQSREGVLRGRSLRTGGEVDLQSIVPYYSRQEIDDDRTFWQRAPILCYVDPIDAFFMQIQGSGRVLLPDGHEIKVGYAAQNGHPYKPIGKMLFDVIPKESMSMQKIHDHLQSLPLDEARKIMNANPSYVFFQRRESDPLTYFGAEVIPGRTIATDQKYFPKGALAYLEYERPEFDVVTAEELPQFRKSSRFVLDQDTGGAIRGPGRVDLFWGSGREAARVSGVMRNPGRLYYILPKRGAQ